MLSDLVSDLFFISLSHNLISLHTHTLIAAGIQIPIVDGHPTTIEIPKGNSDLGLSVSWAEREVILCTPVLY